MSHTVFVFGTDHGFQRRDPKFTESQHNQFVAYVTATVRANGVVALAEENSAEAVADDKIAESTIQTIAREHGLRHRHCDPDRKTRAALKIRQENGIRASFMLEKVSVQFIQQQIEESMRRRERHWLKQILDFNVWPVLFICGANHSLAFLNLLRTNDVDAVLVAQDWGT